MILESDPPPPGSKMKQGHIVARRTVTLLELAQAKESQGKRKYGHQVFLKTSEGCLCPIQNK